MASTDFPSGAACPGCLAAPVMSQRAVKAASEASRDIMLSLPTIHCAGCISSVERGLMALDGVEDVRVNLTRKRATVRAAPQVDAEALTTALAAMGYDAQPLDGATLSAATSDRAARDLAMRLGVSGFAMMNVMLLSVAVWSGASDATRDLFHWISAAIALPTIAFAAQPFFRNAWTALSHRRLNMDVPITLAILLASGMSLFETIQHGGHAYFDAALSLTFFLLAGRYLDQKMRSVARSAAAELTALEVPTALLVRESGPQTVALAELAVGDVLLVRPGARMPVDGLISEGQSEVDRAFLTGETEPVSVAVGDTVRAGEVNLTGPLHVQATAIGADTLLHSLADLVSVAEEAKSRYNSLADRAAQFYAPVVHLLAFAAFLVWMWMTGGDVRFALNIAVAVLIITCPCALGLAVPAVSTVASGRLFRSGLLVKHATALERLAEVDAVVFDKTGTLTLGVPRLLNTDEIAPSALAIARSLALASSHPRSVAIVAATDGMDLPDAALTDIREVPGMGVEARLGGQDVRLGRAKWLGINDTTCATWLALPDTAPVPFEFADTLRPGAHTLVSHLKALGLPVTLLSGDGVAAVRDLATELGITDWHAGVLPDEKASALRDMQASGKRVLMVGDGLNDTAALATAHVSISPASALEAARVASDIVLVSNDLGSVGGALKLARSARRRILENFGIAALYNCIAVPIAFFGFATPLAAALAMSTSSIIVSVNAFRTR